VGVIGRRMSSESIPSDSPKSFFERHSFKIFLFINISFFLLADWGVKQIYDAVKVKDAGSENFKVVRIQDPVFHHSLKPLVDTEEKWGNVIYRIRTNSLGFKDRECREVPLNSSKKRVVFIGDSMTEAIGIVAEKTWVGLIEDEFAKQNMEVLNASTASYCPLLIYLKSKHYIETVGLKTDALIAMIDVSDAFDEQLYAVDEKGCAKEVQDPLSRLTFSQTVVSRAKEWMDKYVEHNFVVMGILWRNIRIPLERSSWGKKMDQRARKTEVRENWSWNEEYYRLALPGLESGAKNMAMLKDLCDKQGIRFMLGINVHPTQLMKGNEKRHELEFWKDWATKYNVPFFDAYEAFSSEPNKQEAIEKYFIEGDVHYNENGCGQVAKSFMAFWNQNKDK